MEDNGLAVNGWDVLDVTPATARSYGLPRATHGYRKLVADGTLVALLHRDDNGWALALSHVTDSDPDRITPGRYPTWAEVYGARRVLIPGGVLMVAVLEPMSYALRLRWERRRSPDPVPVAPGLPTTVKVVQMYCEGVTEDCVFGTEDVPDPTSGFPTPATRPDPVGPVPDAYPELGEPVTRCDLDHDTCTWLELINPEHMKQHRDPLDDDDDPAA